LQALSFPVEPIHDPSINAVAPVLPGLLIVHRHIRLDIGQGVDPSSYV
jgi:hypothetical protein